MIGQSLGRYTITAAIGAGGMGAVYRATDQTLGREVAIKVLPQDVAQDADRLARFEREAKAVAALSHPNILAIHDFGQASTASHEPMAYAVMELLDGESLRQALASGALSPKRAAEYGRQIAEGLAAAHSKGIVHRDLKPENLFVTRDGLVKILDFGLARQVVSSKPGTETTSPTIVRGTEPGIVMGTVGYMAPEQVRGEAVDHRADIFSFGVVLYEMLAGRRAFERTTGAETMTAILREDAPSLSAVRDGVPLALERVVDHCLEKRPDDRFQSARDLAFALGASSGSGRTASTAPLADRVTMARPKGWRRITLVAAIAAAALAGIAVGLTWSGRAALVVGEPVRRLSITGLGWTDSEIAETAQFQNLLALSPDGSRLVYSAVRDGTRRLYVRALDGFDAQPIKGTENGYGPFFSPDGASLAFAADGKLKRMSLSGGLPQVFGAAASLKGGAWRSDGTVFYSPLEGAGLWRTTVNGGHAESLVLPDSAAGELGRGLPRLLPDGRSLLFTSSMGGRASRVGVYMTTTGKSRILVEDANNAFYLPPDHLVYGRGNEIWGAAFDPATAELVGEPQRLVEHVWAGGFIFSTFFTVSDGAVLVYAPASPEAGRRSLVWVDRTGHETPITRDARAYAAPRLSPDGTSILVRIAEETIDIWRYEIGRGVLTRLTSDPYVDGPVWSADGKSVVYVSNKSGVPALYRRPVVGEGEAVRLGQAGRGQYPETLSKDGKTIVAMEMNPTSGLDLYLVPIAGDAPPVPLLVTGTSEYAADLSPDRKWFTYVSRASGRNEVWVRPVAPGGDARQLSLNGGTEPRWSRAGGEIFYRAGRKMMVADVRTAPALEVSTPRALFEGPYEVIDGPINYDVTPDGRRFLMVKMERPEAPTELRVVTGWNQEVRKALR